MSRCPPADLRLPSRLSYVCLPVFSNIDSAEPRLGIEIRKLHSFVIVRGADCPLPPARHSAVTPQTAARVICKLRGGGRPVTYRLPLSLSLSPSLSLAFPQKIGILPSAVGPDTQTGSRVREDVPEDQHSTNKRRFDIKERRRGGTNDLLS
jgi:hypothetical protein